MAPVLGGTRPTYGGKWGGFRDASWIRRIADLPGSTTSRTRRYTDCDIAPVMSRPPRIDGFSYLGPNRYFVTFCTFDRRETFTDIALGQSVVLQFQRTCRQKKFALLAYCLMPDHVHLLVEGRAEASDLRGLIKSAKQSSGQRFAAKLNHPLWQDGFHDRVLRKDDDAKKIAKYIIQNPVRAGLVRSPFDYPLSGSAVWTLEELVDGLW